MRKVRLTLVAVFLCLFQTSCTYIAPSHEKVYEELVQKFNYKETYIFSYASAFENELAPLEEQNNPYGIIYSLYGEINGQDTLYIYGIAEWGVLFEPFIYKRPLKANYDECLNLFEVHIPNKTFNKNREDNISILSNKDIIESIFSKYNIDVDKNFVLVCDSYHYVYEVNGNLYYDYIS